MTSTLIGDRRGADTHTEGKAMWWQRHSLVWCSHKPRNVWSYQKLEDKEWFSPRTSRACVALVTPWFWTSCLCKWENKFLCAVTMFMVIYYSSHRLETQLPSKMLLTAETMQRGCYGLNCVSLKFICWSPNPQYLIMWPIIFGDRAFKEVIKLKWCF